MTNSKPIIIIVVYNIVLVIFAALYRASCKGRAAVCPPAGLLLGHKFPLLCDEVCVCVCVCVCVAL